METSKIKQVVKGITLTRKPYKWETIAKINTTTEEQHFNLGQVLANLEYVDGNWLNEPLDEFRKDLPRYFILVRENKKYLVNTEGYNYCRYIGLI